MVSASVAYASRSMRWHVAFPIWMLAAVFAHDKACSLAIRAALGW